MGYSLSNNLNIYFVKIQLLEIRTFKYSNNKIKYILYYYSNFLVTSNNNLKLSLKRSFLFKKLNLCFKLKYSINLSTVEKGLFPIHYFQ